MAKSARGDSKLLERVLRGDKVSDASTADIAKLIESLRSADKRTSAEDEAYFQLLVEFAGRDPIGTLALMESGLNLDRFGVNEALFGKILEGSSSEALASALKKIAVGTPGNPPAPGLREALVRSLARSGDKALEYSPVLEVLLNGKDAGTSVSLFFGEVKITSDESFSKLVDSLHLNPRQKDQAISSVAFARIQSDPATSLKLFAKVDVGVVGSAYGKLFESWFAKDAASASEALKTLSAAQLQAALKHRKFLDTLVAKAAPDAVVGVIQSMPMTAANAPQYGTLIEMLSKKDRTLAFQVIEDLPPSSTRDEFIRKYWGNADIKDSEGAATSLSTVSDPSLRPATARGLLEKMLSLGDEQAQKFVLSAPADCQSALSSQMISHVNQNTTKDAVSFLTAEFNAGRLSAQDAGVASQVYEKAANNNLESARSAAETLPESLRIPAYAGLMTVWCKSDPVSAGEWLSKISPGPARDSAVAIFVKQIESTDPAMAAEWKATIGK